MKDINEYLSMKKQFIYLKSVMWLTMLLTTINAFGLEDFKVNGMSFQYISTSAHTVRLGWYNVQGNSTTYGGCISNNTTGEVIIPSEVVYGTTTYTVVEIAQHAFSGCAKITKIVIPETITTIGESAFSGCTSLTEICIPETVTSIGKRAFENCTSLVNVDFPESITNIGQYAFNQSGLKKVEVPNSVTNMSWAFYGCKSLESAILGENVGDIKYAFYNCSKLSKIISRMKSPVAYSNCFTNIATEAILYVPIGTTSQYNMSGWNKATRIVEVNDPILGTVNINNEAYDIDLMTNENAENTIQVGFGIKSAVTEDIAGYVEIPEFITNKYNQISRITRIGPNAFLDCSNMSAVVIPPSVVYIDNAFSGCSNLKEIKANNRWPDKMEVSSDAFDNIPNDAVLIVPAGTRERYEILEPWSKFAQIIESSPVSVGDISSHYGSKAELPVYLKNTETVEGLQFKLTLPDGVSVVEQEGNLFASTTERTEGMTIIGRKDPDAENNYLFVAFSLDGNSISGTEGAIMNVRLNIAQDIELGVHDIKLEDVYMTTSTFETLNPATSTSELTIVDYLLGDVNGDGNITAQDASLVLQLVAKKVTSETEGVTYGAADVNGDGQVTAQDASLILQYVAKKITW